MAAALFDTAGLGETAAIPRCESRSATSGRSLAVTGPTSPTSISRAITSCPSAATIGAVVIMTSNLGADRIQAHARRNEPFEELKDELMDMLRQSFRPELLNRIDEIIVFRSLDRDQLMQITRLLLARVARRMHAQGVELEVSDEAVQYLANAGFDPQYGARPLRRAIQRLLEDELSERLLAGEIEPGQRVRVDLRDGRLNVETVPEAEAVGEASETGARA